MRSLPEDARLDWFRTPAIRPFVLTRPENRPAQRGAGYDLDWFSDEPVWFDPFRAGDVGFTDAILNLDRRAYAASGMTMPRWVFYDCAAVPGLVTGFAIARAHAGPELLALLAPTPDLEWLPLSMFIVIPTPKPGEWLAHNLCSVNAAGLPGHYGLGFLTKAFGLWYAGVRELCGVAQWGTPALKLHAQYGPLEVLTAYTPAHTAPATLTYRVTADAAAWGGFFTGYAPGLGGLVDAGFTVAPNCEESLKSFQRRLEERTARYYLNANQIRTGAPDAALNVYKRTHNEGY